MVMPTMGNGMQAITEPMENLAVCGIRSSSAYPPNTLWATSLIAAATLALLDMTASPFRSRLDVPVGVALPAEPHRIDVLSCWSRKGCFACLRHGNFNRASGRDTRC